MALSPMMKQYLEIKEQYNDVILLFRLGDFYEMFYEDAIVGSRELELTLTGRDCGLEERAPMCGVPHHAVETYIAKLIEKGFKVAICEQTTEPGQGKIVERAVVRIITAGTVTESSMLAENENNYLMSIYFEEGCVGVSWADITTGEFSHAYIEAPSAPKLNDLLARIEPSEIICNSEALQMSLELSIVKFGSVCPFTLFIDTAFEYEEAKNSLREQLSEDSIKALSSKKLCLNSAGALLEYIKSTQKRSLSHINKVQFDCDDKVMIIDNTACKTLELVKNTKDSGKDGTIYSHLNKTATNMGSRFLHKLILQPSLNPHIINERLDSVNELLNDAMRDKVHNLLKQIYDIERIASKIPSGGINPKQLLALGNSLKVLPQLKVILKNCSASLLKKFENEIIEFAEAASLIFAAINDTAPVNPKDGNIINNGFDAELDEYRSFKDDTQSHIAKLEADEKQETGIKNLKIAYNRVFGYYIEIPKNQIDLVPYRYTRKQTVASGERYITQELKDLEIKVLDSYEKLLKRELELYDLVVQNLMKYVDDMLSTAKIISYLDCLVSFAIVSKENNYSKPLINDEVKHIKIIEGRHCIVEKLLKSESYVPNDTYLNKTTDKIMVITGPNMAGKSIYMRQVALITILAHMGCFVPAKSAEISLTDRIFTRVGASDDLTTGRSTFMVEMSEVASILANVTSDSLILLDEIGRGTSTYDGLSIAWSIIEYLSKNLSAKALFSTHYHELTELEGVLDGVKNYKLTIKEINNTIIFLRKLLRGSANRSFGIEVAGIAGLPKNIVFRAKEILKLLENTDIGRQSKNIETNQISMFSIGVQNEITSILCDLDTDNLTPRHALDILVDLKEKAEKNGGN